MNKDPVQVASSVWWDRRREEAEGTVHPCSHPQATQCECKGSCSCHWVQPKREYAPPAIELRSEPIDPQVKDLARMFVDKMRAKGWTDQQMRDAIEALELEAEE